MREIELKFKIDNLKDVQKKCQKHGFIFSQPIHQRDEIFVTPKTLEQFDVVCVHSGANFVRIRQTDDNATLTLKRNITSELDCLEHETIVENPSETKQILLLLGLVTALCINKTRQQATLGNITICLDRVEQLGNFIEIEHLSDDGVDIETVTTTMRALLKDYDIDTTHEITCGYNTLLYKKQ